MSYNNMEEAERKKRRKETNRKYYRKRIGRVPPKDESCQTDISVPIVLTTIGNSGVFISAPWRP